MAPLLMHWPMPITAACYPVAQPGEILSHQAEASVYPTGKDAQTVGVLHVINGEYFAGAERVQDLLALKLVDYGFQVAFACLRPGQFASCRKSLVPLYDVPMAYRGDIRPAAAIARLVRDGGFRLIHTHTVRSALVGRIASVLADVPMVYHVHSPTSRNTARPLLNFFGALVERWSVAGAAHVIAVSQSLARHMQSQGVPRQKITVVYNGVPSFDELSDRSPPQPPWNIGVVALFRPRKGIEVLLQALSVLKEQDIPFELQAVGGFEDAAYQKHLERIVVELKLTEHVHWRGFTTDVTAELRRMDMLVLPSLFGEGLPMVVLEAMASGVPVVATDVEGVSEAIRNGKEGIVVAPGNPEALAEGIRSVISGAVSWSDLRVAAWHRQRAMFSHQSMAAGVADIYRRVLDGASAEHTPQ